jgi:hypothetical protein
VIPKVRHYGRIDKAALHFGEPPRIRDRKWLDTFEHKECWNCGEDGSVSKSVVPAHIRWASLSGTSLKPGDDLTVPLCGRCHADQEANPGPEWWAECLKNYVRSIYRAWKQSQSR